MSISWCCSGFQTQPREHHEHHLSSPFFAALERYLYAEITPGTGARNVAAEGHGRVADAHLRGSSRGSDDRHSCGLSVCDIPGG